MPTIYTLGYSGVESVDLLTVVQHLNLVVIDTRYSPRSLIQQWNGDALARLLGEHYQHVPPFGNRNYKNGGEIDIVDMELGITIVRRLFDAGLSIVLLCGCWNVETCHRHVIADALSQATNFPVVHWTPTDVRQKAALIRQPRLFGGDES